MKFGVKEKDLKVNIRTFSGDIEIIDTDDKEVEVVFSTLRKNAAVEMFDVFLENNTLTISQKNKTLSQFSTSEEHPVLITIPRSCKISGSVNSISGDIRISGITAVDTEIKTKSGDITVSDASESDMICKSVSGDIRISGMSGSLDLSSISGDISASGKEISKVFLKTVSGDIELKGEFTLERSGSVATVSGDINVDFVSYEGDNTLKASTVSGDIDLSGNKPSDEKLKISQVKADLGKFSPMAKDLIAGTFGNVVKNIKSHFKDINSERSEPEIKKDGKNDQSVQKILDMVSEGKISVEEAEKLIKALN
ncbi:MAG: DUF4097 family beta strand repeat-containing protein [Candidatus Delongbacteria bacterium]